MPPALCLLGLGVLVFGMWPRLTAFVAYGALGWSFLVDVIGGAVNVNHWVLDTSVLHQMAAVPAVSPNWMAGAVLIGISVIAALIGGVGFGHQRPRRGLAIGRGTSHRKKDSDTSRREMPSRLTKVPD